MMVPRPDEFFARLGRGGLIGFGEAYQTGAWDAADLGACLTVLAGGDAAAGTRQPAAAARSGGLAAPTRERSTRANSRRNIAHHYDLSNELFEQFLDASLTYSSGIFEGEQCACQAFRG